MDKNITLLRCEHPCSLGMYSLVDEQEESVAYAVFGPDHRNHKAPEQDKKLTRNARKVNANLGNYWYAFKDREQLRAWIWSAEYIQALHDRGIVVSEYVCKVSDVVIGSYQCCFSASVTRESFSLLEYFDIESLNSC